MIRRTVGSSAIALLLVAACGSPETSVEPRVIETRPPPRRCTELYRERFPDAGVDLKTKLPDGGPTGPIRDADAVVSSLRDPFRGCYNRGLRIDPSMQGCVMMRARVTPDGDVATSEAVVSDGLSDDVVACLVEVLRGAHFSAPGGGGSTLMVPVTFVQSPSRRPR